nr:hypothetical protein [Candidatus Methanofastidiosa archaeon]
PENLVSPGEDGEVVIMENPEGGDMDGDGVPDDRDECPTVPGDAWNGCPTDENGNIEKVIGITDDINTGEGTGFPVTIVSVVAGIILGAIVVIGMTVRRKK